jgi:hypothetical protein
MNIFTKRHTAELLQRQLDYLRRVNFSFFGPRIMQFGLRYRF